MNPDRDPTAIPGGRRKVPPKVARARPVGHDHGVAALVAVKRHVSRALNRLLHDAPVQRHLRRRRLGRDAGPHRARQRPESPGAGRQVRRRHARVQSQHAVLQVRPRRVVDGRQPPPDVKDAEQRHAARWRAGHGPGAQPGRPRRQDVAVAEESGGRPASLFCFLFLTAACDSLLAQTAQVRWRHAQDDRGRVVSAPQRLPDDARQIDKKLPALADMIL